MAEDNTLKVRPKRFPRDVREEVNKIVHRGSWQALTKEFSVDLYTGLEAEALDSKRAAKYVVYDMFGESHDKDEKPSSVDEPPASPYTDLSQHLGDHLIDYEMVEDLIERGILAENEDGTLYIQLK